MTKFNSLRLALKLPLIIVGFTLTVAATMVAISYYQFRAASVHETEAHFRVTADERRAVLSDWFDGIRTDLLTLAASPIAEQSERRFATAWTGLGGDAAGIVRGAYVDGNPNPEGEHAKLDSAATNNGYDTQHAALHPYFRAVRDQHGYHDVFLFDPAGNLIYTVDKEADFGTNFLTGAYAKSGLGTVYRAALEGKPGETYFADFASYAPSAGAPASFLATPITGIGNQVIGVLAYQISVDRLSAVMSDTTGMGQSGRLYLVAGDLTARSPAAGTNGWKILDKIKPSPQIASGLDGTAAFFEGVPGVDGNPVVAQAETVEFYGRHWALVAEEDMAELLAPVVSMRNMLLLIAGIGALAVLALGVLVARGITRPLQRVGDAMTRVAEGSHDVEIAEAERGDEIGAIAGALVAFKDKLRLAESAEQERRRLHAEQERVVEALSVGLTELSRGNLTGLIDQGFAPEYEQLRQDFNHTLQNLDQTIAAVIEATGSIRSGAAEILAGLGRPVAPYREPGGDAGGDGCGAGRADQQREIGRRGRPPGRADRRRGAQRGRAQRQRGRTGGFGDDRDREELGPHFADHRCHRRHRVPDQPAGAQRRRRGGAGRRCRQGLRRRRLGGAGAGAAVVGSGEGDQGADRRQHPAGRARCRPRRQGGRGAGQHRRSRRPYLGAGLRDRQRRGRAIDRADRDQHRGHPA